MVTLWAKINKVFSHPTRLFIIHFFVCFLLLAIDSKPLTAQNSEVIVFSENWDNSNSLQPWSTNYNAGWFHDSPKIELVQQQGRGNSLKVNMAQEDHWTDSGFRKYPTKLNSKPLQSCLLTI